MMENERGAREARYKQVLLEVIQSHLPGCTVHLFGSRARGRQRSGSDFDLALDAGRKLSWAELGVIKEAIEETSIPVFVDLIDVHTVSADFLKHIQTEWVLWKQ